MKVSAKTEYACAAMLELAISHASEEPIRIRQIADLHQIPQRFLVQILLQLKGAGFVVSTRGASGGYRLSRPPEKINLAEVVATIEGPLDNIAPAVDPRASTAGEVLYQVWRSAAAAQLKLLEDISLADLARQAKGANQDMYYI